MAKYLLRLLGPVVYYASAAAAMWWFLNRMQQVNGIGWLQRRGPPFNAIWYAGLAGGVIGLIIGARQLYTNRRQQDEFDHGSDKSVFRSAKTADDFEPPAMPIFIDHSSIERHARATQQGVIVDVFDLTTRATSDDGGRSQQRTIVLLPARGLPQFHLAAKQGSQRFLDWIGLRGVTFDPQAGKRAEDRETIEQFGRRYRLESGTLDDLAAGKPESFTERDEAVRRVFTLDVLKFLAARPGWFMESHGGYLACWRGSGFVSNRARESMIAAALNIRERLMQPPVPDSVIPAAAGEDRARQAGRMQGALLGVLIGLVAGFFGAFITIFWLFVGKMPAENPGFPVEILLLPVIMAVGAVIGGLIGSRLPVREPILKELPNPKHNQYVGCAVQFGLFGGFFAGAIVGAGLALGLGLGGDQFPLVMTFFFGGAGLGLILGPIIAGRTVYYLLRPRSPDG